MHKLIFAAIMMFVFLALAGPLPAGATWQPPELIDAGAGNSAVEPQIAFDGAGNAIAVWYQSDGSNNRIYANRWNGTTWGTAELIDAGAGNNAVAPQVAFDGDGNAIAVWLEWDGPNARIYANRWDGTTWGTAELIDAGANHAWDPQIAFDGAGVAIAVWQQSDGWTGRIYANRWDGAAWGTAELIDAGVGNHAYRPQIAFDGPGNAIAVWTQYDGSNDRIYANRWNGTTWGTAELIDAGAGNHAHDPQIAFDGSANAIAVWLEWDGSNYGIYANRWNGTTWGTAELIDAGAGNSAGDPQIAFDGASVAIAVWQRSDGSGLRIYANRWDGTAWGTAELIDAGADNSAWSPQIAFDGPGVAIAVWYQWDGSNDRIYANRWNGTAWGTAELIDAGAGNDAREPQIAFDGAGNAIAVWRQSDGSNNRIYAASYSPPPFSGGDGTVGDPWQIATAEELDNVRNYLGDGHADKHFVLIADIDLNVAPYNSGEGWVPIGTSSDAFTGAFNGDGHSISNLFMDRSSYLTGLFGRISGATIRNLELVDVGITGSGDIGGLAGEAQDGSVIENVSVAGAIEGEDSIGGLAGQLRGSTVTDSQAAVTVEGRNYLGGLIGQLSNASSVSGSHATGSVSGSAELGGLAGYVSESAISKSYATGNVNSSRKISGGLAGFSNGTITDSYATGAVVWAGDSSVIENGYFLGGLVGTNRGEITGSHATGEVSGISHLGGLVGTSTSTATVAASFATGDVTGTGATVGGLTGENEGEIIDSYAAGKVGGSSRVGGLIGTNTSQGNITSSYATGLVDASGVQVGGLIGDNSGTISTSYYDSDTTGQSDTGNGEPRTTAEMKTLATFSGDWDIVGDPTIAANYPFLVWQGQESYTGDPVWVIGTQDLVFSDRFELSGSGGPLTYPETEVDVAGSAM
jgi:hypothetical protein